VPTRTFFFVRSIDEHVISAKSPILVLLSANPTLMKPLTSYTLRSAVALLLLFLMLPLFAFAATAKPTCELTVTTTRGSVTIEDKEKILLIKGEAFTTLWESRNAKEAFDDDGDEITLDGSTVHSPKKNKTYTYQFENGSRKAICEVAVQVVEGDFKESSLSTKSVRPTLGGTASGTRSVQVAIYKEGTEKPIFTSNVIKVKNGKWSTKVSKSLKKGEYDVVLLGEKKTLLNTIATSTLRIGQTAPVQAPSTTFVAESVPLLNGGTAKGGATIPVSYIQVINIGNAIGKVEAFNIKQNGSASTNAVVGFTLTDNRSTASVSVGSVARPIVFKDGVAKLPVNILIGAGEMRLFTIKAILAPMVGANMAKQLKLDVVSVDTNGKMGGTFPIRGTTWTLGL